MKTKSTLPNVTDKDAHKIISKYMNVVHAWLIDMTIRSVGPGVWKIKVHINADDVMLIMSARTQNGKLVEDIENNTARYYQNPHISALETVMKENVEYIKDRTA